LVEALVAHVNAEGSLTLDVEEGRLLYEGEQVYSHETSRDNLAFLMFRDGIRSLSFHPGLGAGEVEAFADRLAHADDLADTEDDLATAFWEQDFTHIDCLVADPFLGGEGLREGTIDALRETVLRRLNQASMAEGSQVGALAGALLSVERVGIDESSLALTAAEVEQSERAAEDPSNVLDDFALVLLEIAGGFSGQIPENDALTGGLALVIDSYLESRNLDGLALVVDRLQLLEAEGRCPAGFVGLVVSAGVTAKGLGRLIEGIGQASAEEVALRGSSVRRGGGFTLLFWSCSRRAATGWCAGACWPCWGRKEECLGRIWGPCFRTIAGMWCAMPFSWRPARTIRSFPASWSDCCATPMCG
jgi:hypothetical protein